jgi:flagellar M-ring protein FliF
MADWAARIASLRERWDKLSLAVRVAVAAGALVAIGAIVFAATTQRAPHKAVLFSNLSDDDAARIVEKLKASNIPYEFGTDGNTLLVPETQVHETRLMLASEGLPSGGGVGFEVFDQQRFGESEFSEQVKYHRALEGELARTIGHLAGVKSARVHLVLPSRSLFATDEQGATASVVVHLVPGWKMRDDQVKGIVHLVASSVRGLDPEHVTLVDGDGRTLGRGSHDEGELANEADGYRREIEKSKERAAQQMLDTTLGVNKSMVRVAAAVSFTREETTEERYDPQTIAQRSFQIVEERVTEPGAGKVVTGVPGTPSNLPGGEAGQQTPANGSGPVPAIRRSETRNYEVSKTMRRAVEPVGRVTGLQVAVVVDGHYKGTGDKKNFEPLSKDELDRISHLVANAIGIDEKRGDRIVVECIAFAPITIPPDDRSALEKAVGPYSDYVMYAALALLALLVWRVLGGRGKKRGEGAPALANVLHPPVLPGAMPAALAGIEGIPALSRGLSNALNAASEGSAGGQSPAAAAPGPVLPLPGATAAPAPDEQAIEQVRKLASDMASSEPEAAARVLRNWLAEGNAGANQGSAGT